MMRVRIAVVALLAALVLPLPAAHAAVPDYRLGDVATENVVTPVPLLVVNPEATDLLKQKVAQQVLLIVRHTPQSAIDAEKELREALQTARRKFMTNLQPSDFDSPAFTRIIREVARESPKDLPFDQLAPLWARGLSDESFVESLLRPLREVMAQPIVATRTENPLSASQSVRVLPMASLTAPPTAKELENPGRTISSGKVLSLWRARRLVETYFPGGQEGVGRFAAAFVRANAAPDPALTEIARSQRTEGVTVNDTYEAAQIVVRKGQIIDRRAVSALAAMREKSMVGTLQTKLDEEQAVAGQITRQTRWMAAALALVCVGLFVLLWRLRPRASAALVPVAPGSPLNGAAQGALPGAADEQAWRTRALDAEGKAERAHAAIRSGVLGWMREKLVRSLFHQRAELLSAQQRAEAEMRELEQRLEMLHTPLQERICAYEKRIEELEKDLAAKGEENRELIGARISVTKQQLIVEQERRRFGTN